MTHAGMLYQLSGNLDADDYHFALELQVAAADDLFYSPLHLKENVIYYVRESNGILGPFVVDIFAKKQKFTDAIEKQILYVPCKVQNYNQIVEPINEVA
jgi:hypothetical protein